MFRPFALFVILGFVIFGIGAMTRAYMTILLRQASGWSGFRPWSTEMAYRRLMKEENAPAWPLILTVICLPVGVLIAFAAVLLSH